MNIDELQELIYIPKVRDSTLPDCGIDYKLVAIDAHIILNNANLFEKIKSTFSGILIDPVTHFLQYKNFREKASYLKLPYSKIDVSQILSDPIYRQNKFIEPVINYQIENGASVLMAPYLCSEEIHSTVFNTNLTMLGETTNYIKHLGKDIPVLAPICAGLNTLRESTSLNAIADFYTDETVANMIDGYCLMIADFDESKATTEELLAVANLVTQLSKKKKVILKQVGAFGFILNAVGNAGFLSSPASGESFSLKIMESDKTPFGRDHNLFIYISELFDYINDFELIKERMDYVCECDACSGKIDCDTKSKQRKTHFLLSRLLESDNISKFKGRDKINYLISYLEEGIKYSNLCISRGSKLNNQHLYRWKDVLVSASKWDFEEDSKDLEKFLKALEEDD